jgi:hypothetical protein
MFTDAEGNFSLPATAETLLQLYVNNQQQPIPDSGAYSGGFSSVAMPMVQQTGFPLLGMLGAGAVGAVGAAALGAVRSAAGRITGFVLASGRRISVRRVAQLAKQVGLQTVATGLALSVTDVAEAVVQDTGKRRPRGITAASLRTTKRTIGQLERAHAQIARAARTHVGRRK